MAAEGSERSHCLHVSWWKGMHLSGTPMLQFRMSQLVGAIRSLMGHFGQVWIHPWQRTGRPMDGRSPSRVTLETMVETILPWYLQGHHHEVVQDFVHQARSALLGQATFVRLPPPPLPHEPNSPRKNQTEPHQTIQPAT